MQTIHDRPFCTLDNMTIKEMLSPALEEYVNINQNGENK